MKKIRIKKIAQVLIAISCITFSAPVAQAQVIKPGDTVTPLIHRGVATQLISGTIRFLGCTISNSFASLDSGLSGSDCNEDVTFDLGRNASGELPLLAEFKNPSNSIQGLFNVLNSSIFTGNLFVGGTPDLFFSPINQDLQDKYRQVNVYGTLQTTALNGENNKPLCVDSTGVLVSCSTVPSTWSCQNNTVVCTDSTSVVPDSQCTAAKPTVESLCEVSYTIQTTDWGSCSTGTAGVCSGSFSQVTGGSCNGSFPVTSSGSCSGQYTETLSTGSCTGTYQDYTKVDWNGNPFNWVTGRIYLPGPNQVNWLSAPSNSQRVDMPAATCRAYFIEDGAWKYTRGTPSSDQFDQFCTYRSSPSVVDSFASAYSVVRTSCATVDEQSCGTIQEFGECRWVPDTRTGLCNIETDESSCQQANDVCRWTQNTRNFSCQGPTSQSDCQSTSSACTWSETAESISCASATNAGDCSNQNPTACTWTPPGESVKTRSVNCINSFGQTVDMQLCIDAGITIPESESGEGCSISTETYAWDAGDWGSCSVSSASVCSGSYTVNSGGSCTGLTTSGYCAASESSLNGDSSNQLGTSPAFCLEPGAQFPNCGSTCFAAITDTNSCFADNEGQCISQSGCRWSESSQLRSCNNFGNQAITQSLCEDQNTACRFIPGGDSVRTRTIACRDSQGNVVSEDLCTEPRPDDAESCATTQYSWIPGSWGTCSNGTQTRVNTCQDQDGNTVATILCPALSPSTTQSCGINGQCNNAIRNGCIAGVANDDAIADTSTEYQWRCEGVSGGLDGGTCSKSKPSISIGGGGGELTNGENLEDAPNTGFDASDSDVGSDQQNSSLF